MTDPVQVSLPGDRNYNIYSGTVEELRKILFSLIGKNSTLTVADAHTAVYAEKFGLSDPFVIPPGENSKTFDFASRICCEAARRGLDRSSFILAVGGGVVGDLAGFASAIYMRGIRVIQIPTSLLAMVDSSVGGKTAVDLPEGKNLAGAFHQPEAVLVAPSALQTLPRKERIGALAEVVKYGAALDAAFFDFLEANVSGLLAGTPDEALYQSIIRRSCEIKAAVVSADERESGMRKLLNYGHTFGHAAELLSNFRLSHGEAVAIGMAAAGRLALLTGRWSKEDERRQQLLLQKLHLPTVFPAEIGTEELLETMKHDKKNLRGAVTMVLPDGIGHSGCVPFETTELLRQVAEELR